MMVEGATVTPSMIARARLYDAVMLKHDADFVRRFGDTFGDGAAALVLAGR
jgi:hypothetical protein